MRNGLKITVYLVFVVLLCLCNNKSNEISSRNLAPSISYESHEMKNESLKENNSFNVEAKDDSIQKTKNENEINKKSRKFLPIFDLYGSYGEMPYYEFFEVNNSLENLKKMNYSLHEKFYYIELSFQPLQTLEFYTNDEKFAITSEKENLVNQQVNIEGKNTYVTSLKTIQLGNNFFNDFFKDYIYEGVAFDNNDYIFALDKEIPIILGYSYKDIYILGDVIKLNFLQENFDFRVIGFFEENLEIIYGLDNISMDSYIFMPSFDVIDNNTNNEKYKLFQQRYYLQKNHGFIQIHDQNDGKLHSSKTYENTLDNLSSLYSLKYSLYNNETEIGVVFKQNK